jgi:hypothetical protein
MFETSEFIGHIIFSLLLASAFFCSIISGVIGFKKKDYTILLLSFFFFFSGFTSSSPSFFDFAICEIILYVFYLFDFVLFSYFLCKIEILKKWKKPLFTLTILFALAFIFCIKNNYVTYQNSPVFLGSYSLILSIVTIDYFLKIIKENKQETSNSAFLFWIASACFFFNLSSLAGEIFLFWGWNRSYGLLSGLYHFLNIFCWIIKYFMILKAITCKIK